MIAVQKQLIEKGVLKGDKVLHRPYNWKSLCSKEDIDALDKLAANYQNELEMWYCLSHNITFNESYICPICKTNRLKFVGRRGANGAYNSTCNNCNANALETKKEKTRLTIGRRTDKQKEVIQQKCRATRLKNHGDENYGLYGSDSFKQNMKDKYGNEYYNNIEKTKQTNMALYGVLCTFETPKVKEKSLAKKKAKFGSGQNLKKLNSTCKDKYNKDYYIQTEEFYKKAQAVKLSKHNEFLANNDVTHKRDLLLNYGQGWLSLKIPSIRHNGHSYIDNKYLDEISKYENKITGTSILEQEMQDYIKSLYTNIICNSRKVLTHNELDVYIPDLKLAFEFNGIYWHSTEYKDKYYHIRKTLACKEKGITLIHIFEDTWMLNKDYAKQIIKHAITCEPYNETQMDGCYYYPQGNEKVSYTKPRAFSFVDGFKRVYLTNEDEAQSYICYDCGLINIERID